jgi:DNA-binding MarR family transcriptional regulator
MAKLTDTQLVILSAAAERDGGAILPLPKSLKTNKAATKALKSLINRGLIIEQPAAKDDEVWRETKDGGRLVLVIADAGLTAIGADADDQPETQPAAATAQPKKRESGNFRPANGGQSKARARLAGVRPGTKQALVIDLLKREHGATIGEIVEATGWQPHSVRGAISGTLKKKLGLTVGNEVVEDRGRVYRIVDRQNAA